MKYLAVFAAVVAAPTAAGAGFLDGNTLLEYCNKYTSEANSYVMGVIDHEITFGAVTGLNGESHMKRQFVCIPEGVKSQQIKDAACNYLRENPQNRHWNASVLVYDAVRRVFPCD